MKMFANNGLTTPPWGVPLVLSSTSIGSLDRGFQPPFHVQMYPPQIGVVSDRPHDQIVIQIVEETPNIQINDPIPAPASLPRGGDCFQR